MGRVSLDSAEYLEKADSNLDLDLTDESTQPRWKQCTNFVKERYGIAFFKENELQYMISIY